MSYSPPLHVGTDLSPVGVKNGGISPHPVPLPMGEGTPELSAADISGVPSPMGRRTGVRGASLRSWQNRATAGAYVSANAARPSFSSRVIAP